MIKFYKLSKNFGLILTFIYVVVCIVWGNNLISIFTRDSEIISIAYFGLNISNLAFFILGINLTTSIYYQSIEVPKYSNIICLFRSLIFLPLSLVVLAKFFGVMGVWVSLIASEGLSYIFINLIVRVKEITKELVV